jgi:hypothetical protein
MAAQALLIRDSAVCDRTQQHRCAKVFRAMGIGNPATRVSPFQLKSLVEQPASAGTSMGGAGSQNPSGTNAI